MVSVVLPVAELCAIWADKVKAIATRGYIKYRDFHDLGFIAGALDARGWPCPDALAEGLQTSASVYQKTFPEISWGIEAVLNGTEKNDLCAFTADMERWFSGPMHQDYLEKGVYE